MHSRFANIALWSIFFSTKSLPRLVAVLKMLFYHVFSRFYKKNRFFCFSGTGICVFTVNRTNGTKVAHKGYGFTHQMAPAGLTINPAGAMVRR